MKKKLNPVLDRKKRAQHGTSNMILIITLLLIPFLHKPVSRQQGSVRIIFEKQRTGGLDTPPLTINLTVKDKLIPVGSATLLLLLFFYVRKKEKGAQGADDSGMVMDDDEVIAAWNQVKKRLLSDDEENEDA
ncbi:hypothetical protein [Chitinophaga sp. CF418]|uniref:hypothetical protein n=1 Tax=Chitinophaga sp. CF418 TaxID=1855287 RepID=UPI0009170134|nr:hypothetical protein [Chitinophaga sp. CF418]SHN45709.1 hypothetical protein SAMN05216311_12126 [Chitinophaga sp. CF418]